ncbi:hypothetical protein [Roseovarius sp.]
MNSIAENPELMKLQAEIEDFISTRDMSRTGFGLWAANDPNLVRDIEAGRELRWSTIRTIRQKMAEAKP